MNIYKDEYKDNTAPMEQQTKSKVIMIIIVDLYLQLTLDWLDTQE